MHEVVISKFRTIADQAPPPQVVRNFGVPEEVELKRILRLQFNKHPSMLETADNSDR
jgi:hypothetical protein